jgi:hypothetical protein
MAFPLSIARGHLELTDVRYSKNVRLPTASMLPLKKQDFGASVGSFATKLHHVRAYSEGVMAGTGNHGTALKPPRYQLPTGRRANQRRDRCDHCLSRLWVVDTAIVRPNSTLCRAVSYPFRPCCVSVLAGWKSPNGLKTRPCITWRAPTSSIGSPTSCAAN